ncbi:hypothetical protein VCHA50P415_20100 [Vibrio chagasii]|nr:hypothetical protein VCHA34O109_20091 [Vibrio chagasii]CAH6935821.1 hypothetical protein VCHA34P112_30194 [Vibrio chagasii]CAH6972633.1 hypothetical protein VCHA29O37_440020 [Vibrio chagasii]CAH7085201.1 hypothetical protein VCHA50P415_20100 [Vibrio chagasii]CAH7097721.1 hypothetical protein VCHA49P379_10387 [Vibrio chagasii]
MASLAFYFDTHHRDEIKLIIHVDNEYFVLTILFMNTIKLVCEFINLNWITLYLIRDF